MNKLEDFVAPVMLRRQRNMARREEALRKQGRMLEYWNGDWSFSRTQRSKHLYFGMNKLGILILSCTAHSERDAWAKLRGQLMTSKRTLVNQGYTVVRGKVSIPLQSSL